MDRCSNAVCCGEEGAKLKGEAFDLLVNLPTLGHDRKNMMPDTGGRNAFPLQSGGALPYPENTPGAGRLRHDRGVDLFPFKSMREYTVTPAPTGLRVPLA